jgi:Protein of unknown function (DUF3095)
MPAPSDAFYTSIPPFERFDDIVDETRYRPVPPEWWLGSADVVDSTRAIAAGRYKAVNIVGASVIAGVTNATHRQPFPFVFAGDGASFAIPGAWHDAAEGALAAARVWADEEVGLSLRVALVPVADIRRAGADVAVARFQVAPALAYAMFAGGGIAWAEAEMKAGRYAVAPAAPGARPDLTGLSCRFRPIEAARGEVVSLLVRPRDGMAPAAFADIVRRLLEIVNSAERGGSPMPTDGPRFSWLPHDLGLEVRASRGRRSSAVRAAYVLAQNAMLNTVHALGAKLPGFDPKVYRRETAANTDFRKFDDGLKLTVDCTPDMIARLEVVLERAQVEGIADYGMHRQAAALMTCFVPDPFAKDHVHFVDGAAGGYAKAAEMLKAALARRAAG